MIEWIKHDCKPRCPVKKGTKIRGVRIAGHNFVLPEGQGVPASIMRWVFVEAFVLTEPPEPAQSGDPA